MHILADIQCHNQDPLRVILSNLVGGRFAWWQRNASFTRHCASGFHNLLRLFHQLLLPLPSFVIDE